MAEATTSKTRRHITSITFTDGGAPAASYAIPVHGDITWTPGGRTLVEDKNSYGEWTGIGPVKGEEQMTEGSIECVQRGLIGSDTIVLIDFIANLEVGTAANTTGSEPAGAVADHVKMWDIVVVTTDETGTETLTFENCTISGTFQSALNERNSVTINFACRQAYPTTAFA